ncbi:MAG: hypothetical protein HY814_14085 [Candidatus Riflebacteria bacterium]|nr:hypothetical protein [Candidatus Riflebacteria bacterium]
MLARHDLEALFRNLETSLTERRRAQKDELDHSWEANVARSSEVLSRLLELNTRLQLVAQVRDRFLELARARQTVAAAMADVCSKLDLILGQLELLERSRQTFTPDEKAQVASLLADELGCEVPDFDSSLVAPDDVAALARILDRSRAGLEAAAASAVPEDRGDGRIELASPEPRAGESEDFVTDAAPSGPASPPPRPVRPAAELEIAGLEEELEEETGILLADEVVDMEGPSRPAPKPAQAKPAQPSHQASEDDDLRFVDDKV